MFYSQNRTVAAVVFFLLIGLLVVMPQVSRAQAVIEEITVTATRRAENLQDVNLAVSAFTQSQLDRMGVNNVERLGLVTPGLEFGMYGAGTTITIRGLGRPGGFEINTDGSVGFMVDGVYRGRGQQTWLSMVDVERVEITRGPQGTLYGRNTTGGNINVVTNKPTDEVEFWTDVLVGDYNQVIVRGMVNAPINETWQTRFSLFYQEHDGFIENMNPTGNDLADEDQYLVRGSVRFAPNENIELIVDGHYWDQGGNGNQFSGQRMNTAAGSNLQNFWFDNQPGAVAPVPEFVRAHFNDGFAFSTTGVLPTFPPLTLTPGLPDAGLSISADATLGSDPWLIDEDFPSTREVEEFGFSARLYWDFASLRLTSITGYTDYEQFAEGTFDFSPIPIWVGSLFNDVTTFSQEFHLSSVTEGPFQWLVGVFYLDDDLEEVFSNTLLQFPGAVPGTLATPDPRIFSNPTNITAGATLNYRDARATTESTAVFAEGTYTFNNRIGLTGGIRYTNDDKTYDQTDLSCGGYTNARLAAGLPADCSRKNASESFDETTWKVGIDYSITDNNRVYAHYSTGFKSGIFNRYEIQITGQPDFATPELVDNFAVGSKNRWLDDRLQINAEVFWNEIDDAHAYVFDTFLPSSIITNAGEASTVGVEVELVTQPTENLDIQATLAYLDAEYDTYVGFSDGTFCIPDPPLSINSLAPFNGSICTGDVSLDVSGNKRELSPEWSASFIIAYDINIGNGGTLTPYLQVAYKDDYFITALNDPFLDHQDSYTQTDIRLLWQSAEGHWYGEAYVQNIEDEGPMLGGFFAFQGMWISVGPEPRTYGVRLGYRL